MLFEKETYQVIGLCMAVHSELGHGFLEAVYKDAIEYEAQIRNIPCLREKKFDIEYKGYLLSRKYVADFVFFDSIILEVKANENAITPAAMAQTLNYLKVSECPLGIVANFCRKSLEYKRIILQ